MNYNYDKFSTDHYDLETFNAPEPGTKALDFTLETVGGSQCQLLDFSGDFLVLEMGSITCPLFQGRRKKMSDLVREFPETSFAVLYVREAHPGAFRAGHSTFDIKRECATSLKEEDGESRTVFIDNLDGEAHRAYGEFPNSVFIINQNGCVVYRSDWNNANAVGRALKALKAGKPAPREGLFFPAKPQINIATFHKAGKGSAKDFFQGLPKLFWKNLIKRNLRVLLGRSRPTGYHPDC